MPSGSNVESDQPATKIGSRRPSALTYPERRGDSRSEFRQGQPLDVRLGGVQVTDHVRTDVGTGQKILMLTGRRVPKLGTIGYVVSGLGSIAGCPLF
jgi:hypothetical protein